MIAVILAAGKGSRLGDYTTDLPKSLLPLNADNKTLLDYNLQVLSQFDLEKIYVVTGFNSHKIEEHLSGNKKVEIIYNPFWNCCNVLGSLYMALDSLNDDFLFLHADTLAEFQIWQNLFNTDGDMIIPFERKKCGNEEMKILLKGDKIMRISKEIDPGFADGEFLGIAKFSKQTIPFFKSTSKRLFKEGNLNQYMEEVIQAAIDEDKFSILPQDILHYNFVEVDFEEDYKRAKRDFGNIKF
jgi:choline kinase